MLRKSLLILVLLLLSVGSLEARGKLQGWCEQGGQVITVAGISSSTATPVQRSYASCTVTVYVAGTSTAATLYSDFSGTAKANPFTASSVGYWFFYANTGNYDVRFSGASIPTAFTLGDFPIGPNVDGVCISPYDYGATGLSTDNQTTAMNAWMAALNAGNVIGTENQVAGCLESGFFRVNTSINPITNDRVRITGNGMNSVILNYGTGDCIKGEGNFTNGTGRFLYLKDFVCEGTTGSGNGVYLINTGDSIVDNVVIASAGSTSAAFRFDGIVTLNTYNLRGPGLGGSHAIGSLGGTPQYGILATTSTVGNTSHSHFGAKFSGGGTTRDLVYYVGLASPSQTTSILFKGGVAEAPDLGFYSFRIENVTGFHIQDVHMEMGGGGGEAVYAVGGTSGLVTDLQVDTHINDGDIYLVGDTRFSRISGQAGSVICQQRSGDTPRANRVVEAWLSGTIQCTDMTNETLMTGTNGSSSNIASRLGGSIAIFPGGVDALLTVQSSATSAGQQLSLEAGAVGSYAAMRVNRISTGSFWPLLVKTGESANFTPTGQTIAIQAGSARTAIQFLTDGTVAGGNDASGQLNLRSTTGSGVTDAINLQTGNNGATTSVTVNSTGLFTATVIGGSTSSSTLAIRSTSGAGVTDAIRFQTGNNGATTTASITTTGLGIGQNPDVPLHVASTSVAEVARFASASGETSVSFYSNSSTQSGYIDADATAITFSDDDNEGFVEAGLDLNAGNWRFGFGTSFNGAVRAIAIDTVTTEPSGSPSGGDLLWAGPGLNWRSSSGYTVSLNSAMSSSVVSSASVTTFATSSGGASILVMAGSAGTANVIASSRQTNHGAFLPLVLAVNGNQAGLTVATNRAVTTGTTLSITSLTGGTADHLCYDSGAGNMVGTCTSLREHKDNISTLPLERDRLMALRPVSFNWKSSGKAQYGFIAEEVYAIDPKMATYYQGKLNGVNFDSIIAILTKTVQDQQRRIEVLEGLQGVQ